MRDRRTIRAAVAVVCAVLAAGAARAADPDVRYLSVLKADFPVPIDQILAAAPKPSKLRLHVRPDREAWREVAAKTPADLDSIGVDGNRRGFAYVAPADGAYDFCLQIEYPDGDRRPRDGELVPHQRVVFDTKPPAVQVARLGTTGIDWSVTDDNLRPDGVQIEARWPDRGGKFVVVTPRGGPRKARDSYTWTGIEPGETLEVRIVARDRANQETVSPPIRLPGSGEGAGLGALAGKSEMDPGPAGVAGGQQARVEYSTTRTLQITSTVKKVTRSGIAASHLWWRTPETNWAKVPREQKENIAAGAEKATIKWEYLATADGQYGFIVIPENGAGGKEDDPRPGDPAQFLIKVDTAPPKVTEVTATPKAGPKGPRVEITWKATDENLSSTPVKIEYAENAAGQWKSVTPDGGPLPNTGRYYWDVDESVKAWKFFIKVTATDLAGLSGAGQTDKEVKIDLDTPRAVIDKVVGTGGKAGSQAEPGRDTVPTAGTEPGKLSLQASPAPSTTPLAAPPSPVKPAPPPAAPPVPPLPTEPLPVKSPDLPPPASGKNSAGGPATPALPGESKKVTLPDAVPIAPVVPGVVLPAVLPPASGPVVPPGS